MKHRHTHALLFLVCTLHILCIPSLAQYKAGQSFSLPANYVIYPAPATYDPDSRQIVKLACSANTGQATRTTERIAGLGTVPAGETFTILKLTDCYDSNRIHAQVQTQHNVIGYIPLPAPSKPPQQTISPPQTSQPRPPTQNTIILYLTLISVAVGIIWYAINTPALAINKSQSIIIISTTVLAILFAFYGYQAIGGAYIAITVAIAGIPWGMLFGGWHNPVNHRIRDESFDFIRCVLGIIPPLILLYIFSRELSTQTSYSIVFTMSSLLFWWLYVLRANALRAEETAKEDTEHRKFMIDSIMSYTRPLLQFLTRYDPDIYPPPVNRRMAKAISTYAKLISKYERANGKTPPPLSDFDLLRSSKNSFSVASFPSSLDSQETGDFCRSLMETVAVLALTADFGLEANTQYAAELTAVFEATNPEAGKKAEAQLPPFVHERIKRVENWLLDTKNNSPENTIGWIDNQLTSLIPDYIAKTQTVIGTPLNGLPVIYEQPMHRYRHTLILGTVGAGKSTTITNLAAQDMAHGKGVIVMSPERNLFERIAPYIPQRRLDDVIYFDPRDARQPIIGFNPFFFEPPITPEEYDTPEEYQQDYQMFRLDKASETYTIFERLCRNLGVTMEPLLNYSMRALVGFPNATIRDFRKLLNPHDHTLRTAVCNDPSIDEATRDFWKAYARNSYYTKSYDPLMNQMDKLLLPPIVDILSTQSFSFHQELNTNARILFLDISTLSGIEAKVIAQLLIASIDKAILKRDKMPESAYIPYSFFIDEWQTYADIAGESLQEIALRLRK